MLTVTKTLHRGNEVVAQFSDGSSATAVVLNNVQDMALADLSAEQLEAWNNFSEDSQFLVLSCPEDHYNVNPSEPIENEPPTIASGATGDIVAIGYEDALFTADDPEYPEGYLMERTWTVIDAGEGGSLKRGTCIQRYWFAPGVL